MKSLEKFFFAPASPRPLGALRLGVALVLLAQALMVRNEVLQLFAHDGIVQGALAEYLSRPDAPHVSWFVRCAGSWGIDEAATIYTLGGAYLLGLVLLAAGLFTRFASVLVW